MDHDSLFPLDKVFAHAVVDYRVCNNTEVKSLATAILRLFEEGKAVALNCIGAQALSQAVKAATVANGELAQQGKMVIMTAAFANKTIKDRNSGEGIEMTTIRLLVGRKPLLIPFGG